MRGGLLHFAKPEVGNAGRGRRVHRLNPVSYTHLDVYKRQLQAPLASWGDTAVGEYRPSIDYPGQSALVGLLGAALGLRREEEAAHAALAASYGFAVGIQSGGHLLRDYHTAQVPGQTALKKRPHATRRDELAVPKSDLHTILSLSLIHI